MRSKSPVFCPSVIGLHFCSAPLCSVGLGLVGAFDLATRALSASLRPRPGRAERKRTDPDKPSLPGDASQGGAADACCTPSLLGLAEALELAARARSASLGETLRRAVPRMPVVLQARSASLGHSNWPLEPARPRWGARPDRAERKRTEPDRPSLLGDASLGRTTDACCTQHRDEHTRAWNARVRTSIYIYIYS